MIKHTPNPNTRRAKLIVLSGAFLCVATLIIAYPAFTPSGVTLTVNQVAPTDILAPHSITYVSDVLTRQARQSASDAVNVIYDPPNPSVSRQQIQLTRRVLDYIDNIRHDTYATPDQQVSDINAINVLKLDQSTISGLLSIPDNAWQDVDTQTMTVVEHTMQGEVREDQIDEVQANVPNLISVNIVAPQDRLITAIAANMIKPNAFYNDQRTQQARDAAAKTVQPETRSFIEGQIVVRAGTVVSEADMEALTQLKLLQPDDHRLHILASAFIAVLLIGTLGIVYLHRLHNEMFQKMPQLLLLAGLFLIFLAGARIFGTVNEFQSHMYPAAAFALIAVAFGGPEVAIVIACGFAVLIGLINGGSLEYATLAAIASIAGVLSLRRVERLNAYFVAGLVIAAINITVGLIFLLISGSVDPVRLLSIIVAGFFNGVLSAGLAVVGLYVTSTLLNFPTSIKLLELSQPGQPLLQRLLREAPGTYQHSLQVANLAEMAAEKIGANAELVRVGALYHDIGKMVNPHFFIENQIDGMNPHDALDDPLRSAQIIIGHVCDGEKLARQHNLPEVFIDFILQHHGTMSTVYFYNKALGDCNCDESKVKKSAFCYPGPRPQTREAAILMLADASESTVRAKRPAKKQEIEEIVRDVVETRLAQGQLDESGLTISDIKTIQEMFVTNLQGVFHPRIAYPPAPTPVAVPVPALPVPAKVSPVRKAHP